MNPNNPGLQTSFMIPKLAARKQIESCGLKWIGVATNPWIEMVHNTPHRRSMIFIPLTLYQSLMYGLFGINAGDKTYTRYSGAGPFNSSSQEQVGRGMAALLSLPVTSSNIRASLEHYSNNFVYFSSFLLTQEKLFAAVKQVTGTSNDQWTIKESSIEQRIATANEKFAQGDVFGGLDLMYCYYMGEGMGGNYEAKAMEDRQVLGIEEEDLVEVVRAMLAPSTLR